MVKRSITITTFLLILTMVVSFIVVLNKSSFAADDDIASGEYDGVDWRITADKTLIIGKDGEIQTFADRNRRSENNWPWFVMNSNVENVIFEGTVIAQGSLEFMFRYQSNVKSIDFSNFDTSRATNMNYMISVCNKLTNINFGDTFDVENVTDMSGMLYRCQALENLDASKIKNTGMVTTMSNMFRDCYALTSLNTTGWDTSNVTSMGYMFLNCYSLVNLDLSHWDTSNVTNMASMFDIDMSNKTSSLVSLNVSNWNVSEVTSMKRMFYNCSKLTELNLSNWNTTSLTSIANMFGKCSSLTTLNLQNFDVHNVQDFSNLFFGCSKLTSIDLSSFNTENATTIASMFEKCSSLTTLNLQNFDVHNVQDFSNLFSECSKLTSIDLSSFNTENATTIASMFEKCSSLTTLNLQNFDVHNVQDFSNLFSGCSKLTSIDLSSFNTENATNMSGMFRGCKSITGLNLNDLNTSNVTDMSYMFSQCNGAENLDFSAIDTSKVETIAYMFSNNSFTNFNGNNLNTSNVKNMVGVFSDCSRLKSVQIDQWDTGNVVDMSNMFSSCGLDVVDLNSWDTHSLERIAGMFGFSRVIEVKIGDWDTSNLKDMWNTFCWCTKLQSLDIDMWSTPKLEKLYSTFARCESLKELDLSRWDTSHVVNMEMMTSYATHLELLNVSSFDYSNVTNKDQMYSDLNNLQVLIVNEDFAGVTSYINGPRWDSKWFHKTDGNGNNLYDVEPITWTTLKSLPAQEIAGRWEREKEQKNVTYKYNGFIPVGASELPQTKTYYVGDEVTVEANATAPGYDFSGWSQTGTFTMPAEDVEITGTFSPRTDTPYTIEYYLEDLNSDTYTLIETDNMTGITDTEVQATEKHFEGFTFDDSVDGTMLSGNISGDGRLALKLYYKRNSYNVTYVYTGDIPNDASFLPPMQLYEYGAKIEVAEDATSEGYTFSGWKKDYITMPAQDIEITGYFIEIPKSYSYKVEYFFDGELDNSLEEVFNAEKDEEISITPQNPLKNGKKNYILVSNNHAITILENGDNVIRVYYESDVLDYEFKYPEGDGIPDKYQIKIIYKVENGSWNDGTSIIKTNVVTLYDENGNTSEQGIGKTTVPSVGDKPDEGYTQGFWNKEIPKDVSSKDNGSEFIYSYEKIVKADVAELGGKGSNPITDDIMLNYLLIGICGAFALMLVRMLRKKYSRKARKIQF